MSTARTAFLSRVREAVAAGNRPGSSAGLEPRGAIGYQGANPDPAVRFCEQFVAAGGKAHLVADQEAAVARILELVEPLAASRILLGRGAFLDSLDLEHHLKTLNRDIIHSAEFLAATGRDALFAADHSITGVDYLIAETGSVVVMAKASEPRALSLLPPVHIAVAERSQLVPDLFDLFDSEIRPNGADMPSCVSLITGPSKTGDIELRLVTGVHGPGEIQVILVNR
jgi:L-lactate dehydrogenase complex protein LldG